ncbi:exopolysaccharide biosynthesis polyprenyl glycosylphosphotransferase [Moheibacter lacus]|uniref:Exopolysaccharide biosynthesis polyprenyl glycosylphosphotransferase n=1 Tax=Moheibacter lacus TaxID=2745851 RepID=A0A838ZND8_9FLAO|nr:exopolysaccharide biosynthesis polyprenyl glycosylphosphotransferase [Moheibacter lacus]MBA5629196.1 exopolysaccharide biosynthesis polyprenyl glycosylphosphotransferase [Moheibacter lacus]
MSKKRYSPYSILLLAFIDLIFLIGLFFLFLFIHDSGWERSLHGLLVFAKVHYKSLVLIILFWLLVAGQVGLYNRFRFSRFLDILRRIVFQMVIFAIILFAISGGKKESLYTSIESFYFLSILFIYLFFSRLLIQNILKYYRKKGFNLRNVILLGFNDNSQGLEDLLVKKAEFGLKIKDIFVVKNPKENQSLLDLNSLNQYLQTQEIDFAYISLGNGMDEKMVGKVTDILENKYIPIGFIPSSSLEIKQSLEINYLDSFPILTYKKYPLDNILNQFIKRVFDIAFTFIVFLFLLSWLLPLLSIMVYFSQGSPILFKQKRNGLNGKEFDCLKFRTMRDDKDNNKKPTERNDPRVTKLGKILRKTSLDELPQFINVLKGEMSIVGPRPHMVSENEVYAEIIKKYSLRHYVKPGITGLAQVKGYRGAVDSDKDMEMRIRTDIYYVRNWSFLLDLFIIYKTGKLMIFGDKNAI